MYTPSAYTLTNTTRPHELNAKSAPPILRWTGRGKIGILAKERNSSQLHKRQNHRQKHTLKRRREEARSAPRADDRVGSTDGRDLGESRYTMKSKLPWFSSVQPRALTHVSIHRLYGESLRLSNRTLVQTYKPLRARACTHTHTDTLLHVQHTFLHFVIHFDHT